MASRLGSRKSTLMTVSLVFLLVLALFSGNFVGLGFSQGAQAKGNEGGTDLKLKAGHDNGLVVIAPSPVETFKVPPPPKIVVTGPGQAAASRSFNSTW